MHDTPTSTINTADFDFSDDLVFTYGIVGTNTAKHAITTIADEVQLALDVRSLTDHHAAQFMAYAEACGIDLGEVVTTCGTQIDPQIWQRAVAACRGLVVDHEVMPSGVGHDAAMDMDDFMLGVEVLYRAVTTPMEAR